MKAKLTKRIIDATKPGAQDVIVWDRECRRFGVKIAPTGTRSYLIQYRINGRLRRYVLGQHGSPWTVDAARQEARQLLGRVAAGEDPLAEREAQRTGVFVRDLVGRYEREHLPTLKPSTVRDVKSQLQAIILPRLGRLRVDTITRADVLRVQHQLRETPIRANRVVATLSKMLSLAEEWGLRPAGANPCKGLRKNREQARRRYLGTAELARFGEVLDQAERDGAVPAPTPDNPAATRSIDVFAVAAIRLLLFTGARLGEVLGLRWREVDLEQGAAHLSDSKTGQKSIQLSGPALDVLRRLPRMGAYVIAGRAADAPRSDLHGPWRALCAAAQLSDLRLHDLRHSFASTAINAGHGLPVIGALLGHRVVQTTARYAHLQADPLKIAAESIGERLAVALSGGR